jgi:dTDP-4-amino-4,6-dideoxygalactose transaminase
MRAINEIAGRHGLIVVEDAAQALGSRNLDGFLGTQSDVGCFSFSVAKIIATGQGGIVVTKSEKTYKKLVAMRTHGVGDIVNATWDQPGFNFRFTDVLAAIGIEQLKLLPGRMEKVNTIYRLYQEGLAGLPFIKLIQVNLEAGEIPVYVEALCEARDQLIGFLADRGIQCRPFYPGLNQARYLNNSDSYPNSEPFGRWGLYLPAGPEQPVENVSEVIKVIREFRGNS